jgi:hypothetical protein
MAERFLVGCPINGHCHRPPFDVVAVYIDPFPENDPSRKRSAEFRFPTYSSVAQASRDEQQFPLHAGEPAAEKGSWVIRSVRLTNSLVQSSISPRRST